MVKILFLCHGNICRSPMAEFIMKALAREAGLASRLRIDSAAVSREDILRVASAVTVEVTYFLEGTLAGEEGTDDDEGI